MSAMFPVIRASQTLFCRFNMCLNPLCTPTRHFPMRCPVHGCPNPKCTVHLCRHCNATNRQSVGAECHQADADNQIATGTTFSILNQLVPEISTHIHPRDLSEGQRLGLALSVVLSANPKILILDEPTRGLDYQAKNELVRILLDFARATGKCVVLATHDVELVAELAHRVIFIADGEIVADGSTLDVLLSSPAFAPQVSKVMSPQPWLKVSDVVAAIEAQL